MTSQIEYSQSERVETPVLLNFIDYLEIVLARKKLIIIVTIIAFIISITISFSLPITYSSTALILPPQQDPGIMGLMIGPMGGGGMANLASDLLGTGNSADMYVRILNSNAVSDAIIDRFKLMQVYDEKYRFDTYKLLDKNVDISAGKKDGIISISVDDKDPQRAANMANAYVEELEKLTIKLNSAGAGQNKIFLSERLAKARVDLSKTEEVLKTFQSKNKVFSVSDQAAATIEGIAQIKAQLVGQEMQLAVLRRQFTDSSNEVKSTKTLIANLQAQLTRLEGNGTGGAIPGVGTVPKLNEQYIRIMREFKVQEALVEMLTKQYEITSLSAVKDIAGIQVIQPARVPDKKSKPKRLLIIFAVTMSSWFFAVLFSFLQEIYLRLPDYERVRFHRVTSQLFPGGLLRRFRKLE